MSGLSWKCRQCPVYVESAGRDESARLWVAAVRLEHAELHAAVAS